jgi:hypothetical protein
MEKIERSVSSTPQEKHKQPITVHELNNLRETLRTQILDEPIPPREKKTSRAMTQEESESEYLEEQTYLQPIFDRFIDGILQEKERFQHIFYSKNGSFYIILKTGECMRLKSFALKDGKGVFAMTGSVNPITKGVVFVNPEEAALKIDSIKSLNFRSSLTLETTPFAIGAIPFDYEPVDPGLANPAKPTKQGVVEWDESRKNVTFRGWDKNQGTDPPTNFFGYAWHRGNPITKIIK